MTLPPNHTTLGRPRLDPRAYEIAARLRGRRQSLGLTAGLLASKLGVPAHRYRSWEKQLGPSIEIQYVNTIARLLNVEADWLSHGTGTPTSPSDAPGMSDSAVCKPFVLRPPLSEYERSSLSARAQARRVTMKLSRPEMSKSIGISSACLSNWEACLPQKPKDKVERQWEVLLGVPEGWLRDATIVVPDPTPETFTQSVTAYADSISGEIRMAAAWLSRAAFSKRTTDISKLQPHEQRLANIFALRYGVAGEYATTLQVIGDQHQLTRERIRQIVEKMADRSNRLSLVTPCINQFAAQIKPHLPATVEHLETIFRDLLGESLSIESVNRFCREILGRKILDLTDKPAEMALSWSATVIDPDNHDAERIRAVRDVAMRMIRNCGAAQIFFVAGAAGESLGRGVLPSEVVQDCRMIPGFEWLLEADGWFWYGEGKENRLIAVAIKILASAGQRVDAEEILAGLVRTRRGYYEPDRLRNFLIEPPLQVVVEVLRRTKNFKNIQYDDFFLEEPVHLENVLSDAEHAVHRMLSRNGNVASRYMLNNELISSGQVKHMALQVSLNNSPIYRQLDYGVFGLRGTPIDAASLKSAQDSVGGPDKPIQAGLPDENGFYRFECELSDYMVRNRIWAMPSHIGRIMPVGEYLLEGFVDPVVFKIEAGRNYRLNRFTRKLLSLGFEAGERFSMAVNPETRQLRVQKTIQTLSLETMVVSDVDNRCSC